MSQQTVIPLGAQDDVSLESFFSERNQPLIRELKHLLAGVRDSRVLYLWGESGSGKTHLLDACCTAAGLSGAPNFYVSLKQDCDRLEKLDDLESDTLVCIDDLQQVTGLEDAQKYIFSLYEKIMNGTGTIIVSGKRPLGSMGLELKDLESRLSSGGVFNIFELNDEEKRTALKLRAHRRGFSLDDKVIRFIMSNFQRDTKSLFVLLDKLDSLSLQTHRKITVPLVKSLI